MRRFIVILLACFGLGLSTGRAAHTQVNLVLSAETIRPGDTVLVGFDLKMDPGWHTYWKNPGESGIATAVKWDLPAGVTAGDIQWPLPHKLPPAEVTTYGYLDEVMLIVPITVGPNVPTNQPLSLTANLSWLECLEQCIPGKTSVTASFNVGGETKIDPKAAALIDSWQKQVPGPVSHAPWSVAAYWEKSADGDTRPLIIEGQSTLNQTKSRLIESADYYPNVSDDYEIQPATEMLPAPKGGFSFRKLVKKYSGDWPTNISGLLLLNNGGGSSNYDAPLNVFAAAPAKEVTATASTTPLSPTPSQPAAPVQSLPLMLLYAFIGGLILNIMPCVLPVIALKILGFVGEARSQPGRVRQLGLVYALGVLVSFLALAGVVIGIKFAGHLAGWGMQFGSPIFVVCLTTLVLLVALNLFGLFEVNLGGRALDSASQLTMKHGFAGAFFNGMLATALATPCTAPFLGSALGFAFAQNATVILLIFFMVGAGLSAPYVALSWNPAWLKYLPKPGAWMEKFKIGMGFPMLLTTVWLLNLAAGTYGGKVLWLGIFLVIVAFAAWIFGEFVQRGRRHQGLALGIIAGLLIGGYAYALENQLHWREAVASSDTPGSLKESAEGIDWQKWTPEAVTAARAAGHPVIVDFTADWCLTCQVNKKTSIEIPSVRAKLKELNAVALLADYTHAPDDITAELSRHGRAGVPMVLVFPKAPDAPAIILPEVLTPSIVLDALARAAG